MKKNIITQYIKIKGASVHNLKNISVDIPKNKLVVITGLSGSGKSSLAFDTIYAEAERRFVESLSSYARQFLGVKDKPDVDSIEGLSPAISIDQKSVSKNPRSTVGTITEIYDYLRILFARIGKPHCPNCQKAVGRQTVEQMVEQIEKINPVRSQKSKISADSRSMQTSHGIKTKNEVLVLAPLVRGKKGEHHAVLEEAKRAGFLRTRIDGVVRTLEDALSQPIDKRKSHSIEIVVDRFFLDFDLERSRIRDSVETALKIGKGTMIVSIADAGIAKKTQRGESSAKEEKPEDRAFSESFACRECGINFPEIEPRTFSFNSPYGACSSCTGLGSTLEVDAKLVFPNTRLSIAEGAIRPWAFASHRVGRQSWYWWILSDLAERRGFSLETPVEKLSSDTVDLMLYGESGESKGSALGDRRAEVFEGIIPNLKRRWKETDSDFTRAEIEKYMIIKVCPQCEGKRLRKEALAVKIGTRTIADIVSLMVTEAIPFFTDLAVMASPSKKNILSLTEFRIATPLIKEIIKRLEFLHDVGLGYLTLNRESTTLAGGEAQRIQLATQIGSRLTGIIYILDEPSIGLHPRDHEKLITTLHDLRNLGNSVIVVEHDAQTMSRADWIIDLGPGAGKHGGKIIFEGTPKEIVKARTLTGEYLSGKKLVTRQKKFEENNRRESEEKTKKEKYLIIRGAAEHNLKNIDVRIPLGKLVCVSGVSGSGKSSLVNDILAKSLLAKFYHAHCFPGTHKEIIGTEHINKVVVVDQSPIGRTPRSNPVTYTGAFQFIRSVFAQSPEARARGYEAGRFSFNVKGGRCESCEGQGVKKIEMYFLPDVYIECEECRGKRYNREALEIEYNGKNIAEVLHLSIDEGVLFFEFIPSIRVKLETLRAVGLGYVKLGQPAPTLSGGEAQRVKLATELSRRDTGNTLYILDEPTTGLHFEDIQKLLSVLSMLVEKGNSVLVIEHNLDILRNADWIIDLGPEGGAKGGTLVAEGTPETIAKMKNSYTGQWLKQRPSDGYKTPSSAPLV